MGLNSTSSPLSYFVLGAYLHVGNIRYFYFMVTALLYIIIVIVNTSLIVVVCVNRALHEPMYVFLCSLFVNEVFGSSGLFPFLLLQILSDVHTVSGPVCFLQIFCVYTYGSVEFLNLAVMSYDRYLAICRPLHYNTRMSSKHVAVLVVVVWLFSLLTFLVTLSLNLRLPLCGNIINSLYCQNYLVVKLACSDTELNHIYGLIATVLTIIVPLWPIFFSYMNILKLCFSGSAQRRQKALGTCAPHLVSLFNFSFGCTFELLQSRFNMADVPPGLRLALSLYFLIMQPLLNPVMYGMQLSEIRQSYKRLFCSKVSKTCSV